MTNPTKTDRNTEPPCTCGHPREDHYVLGPHPPACVACDCMRYVALVKNFADIP